MGERMMEEHDLVTGTLGLMGTEVRGTSAVPIQIYQTTMSCRMIHGFGDIVVHFCAAVTTIKCASTDGCDQEPL